MYRRNIYYYIINFQMKQNICRAQNFNSNPNKSLPVGDNNQSLRSQQIHLLNTEQSKKKQLLNIKIEEWRKSNSGISLAKIVKLQVIRREKLLLRKILSFILRDSPRCYRRLPLREIYEKPRKDTRKIRIFHDSAGALVAFYNSKNFKIITLSQIQEISKKVVVIGKLIIRNSLKPRIKLYISKYRKRIPVLRSYFARRINVLRNRQKLINIVSRLYNKNGSIKKSSMEMNKERVNSESRNILNVSMIPDRYPFASHDRKQLESLMAFYFTKFQEGIPAFTNYFSKFSQIGWRGEITKYMTWNKDMKYENNISPRENISTKSSREVSLKSRNNEEGNREIEYNKYIFENKNESFISNQKPYNKPEEAIFNKASWDELKLQSNVQGSKLEKSLNDINVRQSNLKNDIETLEKLLSVQKELVNLNSSLESREVTNTFEPHIESDLERTISEIEKYDNILRELNLNNQMKKEKSREEHGKPLNDQIDVSIGGEKSELGNFPDDIIINSYRKFKGNYLSLDLIDNALMITTPIDPNEHPIELNEKRMRNSEALNDTQPNNAKFMDTRKDSKEESSTKNKLSGEIEENFDFSIISNQIAIPKDQKTGREMRTYGADSSFKEIEKTSNEIDVSLPLGERSSLESRVVSNNIRNDTMDHKKRFEFDNNKSTSSYLRINENKQFAKFNTNLFSKNEKRTKVDKGLQRLVGGNKIKCSESHKIGDYPELKNAVRDSNKRFSVSKILGCDRPPNLNREIPSHSNALKNNTIPKKKTRAELEKQPKSIKYMQNLLLSNNERSKYHTQSDLVIKEEDSEDHSFNKTLSEKEATSLNELKISIAQSFKENEDENIFSDVLRTNDSKIEAMNEMEENTNIKALNKMRGYEQKLFKDMFELHNNPFLVSFSGFQEKIDNLQNRNETVDSKSLQLNSMSNHQHTSTIDENPIKTPESVFNLELPHHHKNVTNDSIGMEEKAVLNNVSLDENSEKVSRNEANDTQYYKNEFDLKCRFDFPPKLEIDSIKAEKTIAENIKPIGINHMKVERTLPENIKPIGINHMKVERTIPENIKLIDINESTKPNQNELNKKVLHLPDLREYPIQNREIPCEIIEQRNINQNTTSCNNGIDKEISFKSEPKLHSHKNLEIVAEPKTMKQSTMHHKHDFDKNSKIAFLPDKCANSLKTEKILAENTRLQNMNKTEKYYRNEFDFKCRFDFPPDLEIKSLEKETPQAQSKNNQNKNSSRKFSDLVLKLEQMKIRDPNWFTQPIELSNKSSSIDEFHPKLNNLNKQLAGGDGLQNENVQNQLDIKNETQNNSRIETTKVSKEIVLPSTMQHYFDHEYSKIMDNFKLPDLKKYCNETEHKNVRESEEKIVNYVKKLQEEKIEIDNNHQDKISINSRMQIVFDKRPINNHSRLQITGKDNKNINLDVPFNENSKLVLNTDGKTKNMEGYSHKLNIDVFTDTINNKIAESVNLIQDIPKIVKESKGEKVGAIQSTRSISNRTIPAITGNYLNNAIENIKNSDIDSFEGENELSYHTPSNNKGVRSKLDDLPTIQEDEQGDSLDKKLNLSEMKDKHSVWEREIASDEKIDFVKVENYSKPLITDEMKASMKNTCFLTAANNLENDIRPRTGIYYERFEEKPTGDGDKAYENVFKKRETIDLMKTINDVTLTENEQRKGLQKDNNYVRKTYPQRVSTMTFVNSDIASNEEHYETLEEDCKSIVREMRGLFIEDENDEFFMNENNSYGQVIYNTNIHNVKNVEGVEDTILTRNVRSNTMLDKQYKGSKTNDEKGLNETVNYYGNPQLNDEKGLNETVNDYGNLQLKNAVNNERFSEIINDNVDDYDYIYSNIFVNSKFDENEQLLRQPEVHQKSYAKIYRTYRKQGPAMEKYDEHRNKKNSNGKYLGEKIESNENTTIVDQEIHRNLELAKLDRLHNVLNDLEKVIGSLTEKVEKRRDSSEGGKSIFDYKEQKMMLCDINDSIISSLASLHIFKGSYNQLKVKNQFEQLRKLEDNSVVHEVRPSFDSKHVGKKIHFEKIRPSDIKGERHASGTSIFEYEEDRMQQNKTKVSNISSSGNRSNVFSKMNGSDTRSNKIVDRFYKYRHRTFLTHLSKIPEEESVVDSENSEMEIREDNLLENTSTKNSLDVLHSSTAFVGSLRPHLNPEHVRKVLKQLCTRCVVNEMLQKTEEASERNEHVLER